MLELVGAYRRGATMKRLPVNLATQPIEQRQWLRKVTLRTAAIALLLTAAHLLAAWSLVDEPHTTTPDAEAVNLLRAWSDEAATLISSVDPRAAQRVAVAAGLANALIDQRVFPWADLFSMLEESMPDNVRLEVIQPAITFDGVRVTLTAASLSGDSLLSFLAALEARPEFIAVYPGRQSLGADREIRLTVEALVRIDRSVGDGNEVGADLSGAERRP